MKTTVVTISLMLFSCISFSQTEGEITIKNLELPSAPAFALLDYSPTNISAPSTPKALTLSLINAVNSSEGIPANYALEFSPYWLFKSKSQDIADYLDKEENANYSKPFKNMSVSFASVKKDSIQNVSIGIRTNLFTINSEARKERINQLNKNLVTISEKIDPLNLGFDLNNPEDRKKNRQKLNQLAKDSTYIKMRDDIYENLEELSSIKPFLSVDAAVAYNHFFDENEFKSGKFGKFGVWTTCSWNISLNKNKSNYLSLYQYGRYLVSEMEYDPDTKNYDKEENFDLGTKMEFQLGKLSVGYEYIKRLSESDNYRSVGNIKYILSETLSLNGGFGKNFEHTDNLVSFLGISWGINANNNIPVEKLKAN